MQATATRAAARRDARAAALFLAPTLLFLAVFVIYPLATAGVLSLHSWDGISVRQWVGLANYERLLGDRVFWGSLRNNVVIALTAVLFQVGAGLLFAYWLVRVV